MLVAGALTTVADSGAAAEDADPRLVQWEFHDLLFHSRSRIGRHNHGIGGPFRHPGRIPPPPLDPPAREGPRVRLSKPGPATRSEEDRALTALMDARRSIRQHGDDPLTAEQLGEFLYRVARLRATGDYHVAGLDTDTTEVLEV